MAGSKTDIQSKSLENAFQTFNDLSIQLAESYRTLENRVASLSQELHQARSERLQQLIEKETIANRLTQLLELLPGGVVVLDGNGLIKEANPVAVEFLGEPLIGELWHQVIERAFTPEIDEGSEVVLKSGRRVSLSSRALQGEPGQIVLLTDVTEQHALQSMLNRHYRLSAMGEMAASLAHQIRTPLATALLYISHLNRPELADDERLKTHDKVISRLRYLDHMVNDMLQFARSGSFDMDCVQVSDLIEDLEQTVESQLVSQDAKLHVSPIDPRLQLKGNHDALLGALMNIVSNAVQATGSGAEVCLSVTRSDDRRIRFRISDNGPGIDKEDLPNLFTPFFTTRPQGTGLGLSVAQTIVEAHHGTISASSEPGQGAVFTIEIPVASERELFAKAIGKNRAMQAVDDTHSLNSI